MFEGPHARNNSTQHLIILSDPQQIWMSTSDMELAIMSQQIEDARGNVLVSGLGMGVYPHFVSRKPAVTSVTIVEPNADVIALTHSFIASDKTRIVNSTIEEFCDKRPQPRYDYCFVDIWSFIDDSYADEARVRAVTTSAMKDGATTAV